MTIFLIWVIAFVLIAYFANKRWESGVSQGLDKMLPSVLSAWSRQAVICSQPEREAESAVSGGAGHPATGTNLEHVVWHLAQNQSLDLF